MTDESNKEIKDYLLAMLKWFHAYCEEHGLRYYALGGTMLGAYRHGGFIPWDDDLDVGMPREDYERLFQEYNYSSGERYILETPYSEARDFNYCFSKLYDTKTTLIENTRYKIKRGLYVDIFPLDGMGNTEKESRANFSIIDLKFKLILSHTTGLRKGRSELKNLSVLISQSIMNPFINDKEEIRKLNEALKKRSFDECEYGGNPFGAWRYKEIMEREIMGKPTLYKFEDTEIYGAENPDLYLTHLYGNWRQLPPIDKQKTHHDYIRLNLKESYLNTAVIS